MAAAPAGLALGLWGVGRLLVLHVTADVGIDFELRILTSAGARSRSASCLDSQASCEALPPDAAHVCILRSLVPQPGSSTRT